MSLVISLFLLATSSYAAPLAQQTELRRDAAGQPQQDLAAQLPVLPSQVTTSYVTADLDAQLHQAGLAFQKLVQPSEIRSADGILETDLYVDAAPYHGVVQFNTRLYNGSYPGPTIRVRPGDIARINLINVLGPNEDVASTENTLHTPNNTNLHTHGMHVSPHMPHDDVLMVSVEPGQSNKYEYTVIPEHYPGSHWYVLSILC